MAKSILQIVIQTLKQGEADKETIYVLQQLQSSIGTATAVAGAMAAAYGVVDQVIGESVRTTVAYADQVRQMSQLTGQSAEESSRMIQVMDDLKVSTDVLTMATKTLSKEGLTMNIDTLAKLSDEYNHLGDGAQKTAFLVKNFGKTGLEMAEAMQQGGEALRKMSAEVDKSLVLNQAAVENARQYERELDNLNDSWTAIKVTIGNAVIPALLNLISVERQTQNATEALNESQKTGAVIIANSAEAARRLREAHQQSADGADSATRSYIAWGKALQDAVPALDDATESTKELTKANQLILSTVNSIQGAEQAYADKSKSLADARAQIERDRAAAMAQGWQASSEKIREYDQALAENTLQAQQNAVEHDLASKKIILGLIQQKLAADGNLTNDELNWLLAKGEAWGIYSEKVVAEAKKAIDEADKVAAAINRIPSSKEVNINLHTNYSGGDYADHVAGNRERDSGGPGKAGQAYIINPSAGPEAFIPATDGYFVPNVDRMMGGGGNVTMVVQVSSLITTADQSQLERAIYPAFMAMVQKAKSDRILK